MGPFLVGLLLGVATNTIKMELNGVAVQRILYTAGGVAVGVIYAILPEYWYPEQGNTLYNTLYTALFRTVFAVAISAMIAALYYSAKRTNVSHAWSVLARLTFNAYLVHAVHLRLQLHAVPPGRHVCNGTSSCFAVSPGAQLYHRIRLLCACGISIRPTHQPIYVSLQFLTSRIHFRFS
jgi:hypothetical protein